MVVLTGFAEDTRRESLQVRVGLDLGQHVEAAAPGQVHVHQDQAGRRRVDVGRLAAQEGQSRLTGVHGVQRIDQADLVEGLLRAPGVCAPSPPSPAIQKCARSVPAGDPAHQRDQCDDAGGK